MQVYGNIATPLKAITGKGKTFYSFRLAENNGTGENRTTTWYDVIAFIDELDADLLAERMFVKVTARVEAEAFMRKDNTPGAALKLITGSIKVWEKAEGQNQGQ